MMDKPRKWDDPTPRSSEMCLKAAKEAAAKVFSRLLAEGKVDPNSKDLAQPMPIIAKKEDSENKNQLQFLDIPLPATSTDSQAFTCEVEINDIAYSCRNLLTKSVTQDDIFKVSGAKVATRGRFMTPEEKEGASGEKPLYLSVQGQTQHNVEVAVQRISAIIQSMCNIPPYSLNITSGTTNIKTLMSIASLGATPHLAFVQDKLFVGLEHAPQNFDVKQKILGPSGSYLQHIQSETGAKVMLKGKGSGFIEPTSGREAFEPMFIYLQHANQLGLQHAKKLAQNLLETVQKEYSNFQQALALAPPSINPGTASMLAGLQQSAAFPPNGQLWNTPLRGGYNSVFQYPCQMPGSAPYSSYQPPLEGPMIDSNGGGMYGYQAPPTLSMFGVPGMMLPPPPPPLPATTNQISSVSALSYYDHYVQSTNQTQPTDGRPSDEPVTDGRTAKVQRRRFQEKLEEEKNDDEDEERGTSECKDKVTKLTTSATTNEKKEDFKVPSNISPTKDEDGFVRPPPLVAALKRKRPDSDVPTSKDHPAPPKVPNNLGGLQGALKSVAACYGSESEDEDDDDDNDCSV